MTILTPDAISEAESLGVLLTGSNLLLLLLLLIGILGPSGVKLISLSVELLLVVSVGTRNRRGRRGGVPSNPDSLARWITSGDGHGYLQSTLGSLGILRALGLQGGQDAGDVVLASLKSLAQRSSDGQSGEGENDGTTHIDFVDW